MGLSGVGCEAGSTSDIGIHCCGQQAGRTQNKDSSAALKTLSRNGFLHFDQCAFVRDFGRRALLLLDIAARAAHSRAAETRMNTHVSSACDEAKRAVTLLLTRAPLL
jgi:hypothetical protein